MNLKLRNKQQCIFITGLTLGLTLITLLLNYHSIIFWNKWDYQVLDYFYSRAIKSGIDIKLSSKIKFLEITDTSYETFKKNTLDRSFLAKLNSALSDLQPSQVIYDIIFAYSSDPKSDIDFAKSISDLGNVYLPVAFSLSDKKKSFIWDNKSLLEKSKVYLDKNPQETGSSLAKFATRSLVSQDNFMQSALSTGHINISSDPDGIYRHYPLIIRINSGYFPSIVLASFLNSANVRFQDIVINWGQSIIIPAKKNNELSSDIRIPIDSSGHVIIPFFKFSPSQENTFERYDASDFLREYSDELKREELANKFIEGRFVFISDVSQGIPDKGKTPIHDTEQPLALAHAAVLNGLLNNAFHEKYSTEKLSLLIIAVGIFLGSIACLRKNFFLYLSAAALLICFWEFTFYQFLELKHFPITTFIGIILFIFFCILFAVLFITIREQSFIRNAFSKYVPVKVVEQILANPEILALGGEKRVMTALFSDIARFTTISEQLESTEVVSLLNEYLTAMTEIVLDEGGIIDKFQGDSVMAEFGAPLHTDDHADRAVLTGLKMQRRLKQLRQDWLNRGLPKVEARIGINTGSMVIGNMGSDQVFDYTVMGDPVNLASRLEGANKPYGTFIMISEFTLEHITPNRFRYRLLDLIKVAGKTKAVKVYEVYGLCSEEFSAMDLDYYNNYQQGVQEYLNKNFPTAENKFHYCLSLRPTDLPARKMIDRVRGINPKQIPKDWDGSTSLLEK